MSNRVAATQVRSIMIDIDASYSDSDIDVFITTANKIIEDVITHSSVTEATLTQVELWLSAHLVAVTDPRLMEESIGDAKDKYQSKIGFGLDLSHYGQVAKMVDWTGSLALKDQSKIPARMEILNPVLDDDNAEDLFQ